MKNLLVILIVAIGLSTNLFAQRPERDFDREKFEAARIAFITNRLDIKPDQAERFWPIYNQHQAENGKLMRDLSQINRSSMDQIDDASAKELLQKRFKIQQELLDKEKEFLEDLMKVLSPSQVLKLNAANREFTRQMYRRQQGQRQGNREK